MDIYNHSILQKNKMVMHSQELYDHPTANNISAKIQPLRNLRTPTSVAAPDDNHHERMTW